MVLHLTAACLVFRLVVITAFRFWKISRPVMVSIGMWYWRLPSKIQQTVSLLYMKKNEKSKVMICGDPFHNRFRWL